MGRQFIFNVKIRAIGESILSDSELVIMILVIDNVLIYKTTIKGYH